jgi:hypothetical protein
MDQNNFSRLHPGSVENTVLGCQQSTMALKVLTGMAGSCGQKSTIKPCGDITLCHALAAKYQGIANLYITHIRPDTADHADPAHANRSTKIG